MVLKGITHGIICFNSIEDYKLSRLAATGLMCFGSDEEFIVLESRTTPQESLNATPHWVLPINKIDNNLANDYPIFNGKIADDLLLAAGRLSDRVRQFNLTTRLSGRVFRVTQTTIEDITEEFKSKRSLSSST